MKGFIVAASNKTIDEKTQVQLFGRLEDGRSFCSIHDIEPYCFIKEKDLKKAKLILSKYKVSETKLKNFEGEEVVKISHTNHADILKIASALHKKEIDTYESDLNPAIRFLVDNDIKGSMEIKGDLEQSDRVDCYFNNPQIKPASFTPNLKIVSLDIEASRTEDKLLCIGLYSDNYEKSFMVGTKKVPNTISCKTELEVLEKFRAEIIKLDPDIITGWHVIDFDFAYLKKKFEENKMSFDIGRTKDSVRIKIEDNFFRDSTVNIPGRQVLDGLNMIQDPFIQEAPSIKNKDFESYTLEDVSQQVLGEGKLIKGKDRHGIIEELFKKDPQKIIEYNIKDAYLAYEILKKTKMIELAIERTTLTGLPMNRLLASVAAFDSLYIREARKKGLVSPSTKFAEREERIKGGYVMKTTPGIFHNVIVLDFKSLYPSIIRTFNIDPASKIDHKEQGSIEAPNHAHFKNQEGILPKILDHLHEAREKAKKEKRELASYAIKIIMNSFFGVMANPACRYYSVDLGNAITYFGQEIIQLTAKKIEEKGYKVIYSDTDSIFIESNTDKKKSLELGKELPEYINNFYKKYVKDNYNRESFLELQFDKLYLAFMLPKVRGSESGSKKRYAGLKLKGDKEEIEIVGLEAIRGDWTEAAKEFQLELLNKVFRKENFIPFIKDFVKKLESGKMDEKLLYRKSIRKNLEEYTKTTPPHVKAARKLDNLDSNIIEYYITTEGPEPKQKLHHPLDYEHYIKKQITPIADTILFFFNTTFEQVLKASKQTTLF